MFLSHGTLPYWRFKFFIQNTAIYEETSGRGKVPLRIERFGCVDQAPAFFDFFTEEANPVKQITTEDLQKSALEILQSVASFCEEKGLRYSLGCGTLLGAIRHKGFIPWDDDIDIIMPRKDYEVFLKTYKNEKYYVSAIEFDEKWPYAFAKCMDDTILLDEHVRGCGPIGAYIDIFPLDGLPDDEYEIAKTYRRLERRMEIVAIGMRRPSINWKDKRLIRSILRYIRHNVCYLFRKHFVYKIVESAKRYDSDSATFVGNQSWTRYGTRNALEREKLGSLTQVMFEGRPFKAFQGYDYYLRKIYGDYMKIPDEEHREQHTNDKSWNLKKVEEK